MIMEMSSLQMQSSDLDGYYSNFLSYKEQLVSPDDTMLRCFFCRGLSPYLRYEVVRQKPTSLQHAIDLAWEAHLQVPPPYLLPGQQSPSPAVASPIQAPMEIDSFHLRPFSSSFSSRVPSGYFGVPSSQFSAVAPSVTPSSYSLQSSLISPSEVFNRHHSSESATHQVFQPFQGSSSNSYGTPSPGSYVP